MDEKLDIVINEIQKLKDHIKTLTKIINCQNNHIWKKDNSKTHIKTRQCTICNLKSIKYMDGGRGSCTWSDWTTQYDSD